MNRRNVCVMYICEYEKKKNICGETEFLNLMFVVTETIHILLRLDLSTVYGVSETRSLHCVEVTLNFNVVFLLRV